jgi:hypothetical protein
MCTCERQDNAQQIKPHSKKRLEIHTGPGPAVRISNFAFIICEKKTPGPSGP